MGIREAMKKKDDIIFVGEGNYVVGYGGSMKETFTIESTSMERTEEILAERWEIFCSENGLQEDCVDYVCFEPARDLTKEEYMQWVLDNYDLPASNMTLAPDMLDGILTYAQGLHKDERVKLLHMALPSLPESMAYALKEEMSCTPLKMDEHPPVYTHDKATEILENFEDLLVENGIKLPSPEDDEREEDNEAPLYGSVYSDLLDSTEAALVEMLDAAGAKFYVPWVYSGDY